MEASNENKQIDAKLSQYIVVRLGAEAYGIDIRFVNNIVRMQRITRVPKMPKYLVGIINLRGEVLPVMSLRIKMDLEKDVYEKKTRKNEDLLQTLIIKLFLSEKHLSAKTNEDPVFIF